MCGSLPEKRSYNCWSLWWDSFSISGLSIQELQSILRESAIRSVAERQLEVLRRVNISGIAASTGIPRAEISRILKSTAGPLGKFADRQQQSTNRILAAWHQDPKFTTPEGKPADLKIYGRGPTFESLVRNHGRGIPTRAMLDELTRAGAAEVLSSRLIRVKALVAVDRGVTPLGYPVNSANGRRNSFQRCCKT